MLSSDLKKIHITTHRKKIFIFGVLIALFGLTIFYKQNLYAAWMRFKLRNEYIVVSLTTTPHRINEIKPVLDFVLNENLPLKSLYLNVPYVFKRDNTPYVIPDWLQNDPRITILRPKDYGPGTKLLGTLEQAQLPPNAIIITVDDDITYPKNALLYLAYRAKQRSNYAVGFSGMNPHYNKQGLIVIDSLFGIGLKTVARDNAYVAVLEGFGGIAYRRKFFDDTIFAIEQAPRECRNSDDVYISYYLAKQGIPRQVLRTKHMYMEKIKWNEEVGFKADALHQLSPRPAERHRACVQFLKAQDPDVPF